MSVDDVVSHDFTLQDELTVNALEFQELLDCYQKKDATLSDVLRELKVARKQLDLLCNDNMHLQAKLDSASGDKLYHVSLGQILDYRG